MDVHHNASLATPQFGWTDELLLPLPQWYNHPIGSVTRGIMNITIEATWENGVLKTAQPLPLSEKAKVQVTIHLGVSRARQTAGLMGWTGRADLADQFSLDPDLEHRPLSDAP